MSLLGFLIMFLYILKVSDFCIFRFIRIKCMLRLEEHYLHFRATVWPHEFRWIHLEMIKATEMTNPVRNGVQTHSVLCCFLQPRTFSVCYINMQNATPLASLLVAPSVVFCYTAASFQCFLQI